VLAAPAGPVAGGAGPEVLHVQVLLDAAGFGPGLLDGHWSENTLFALRAFRDARGLGVGDTVDASTYAALRAAALDRPALTTYPLSDADVRGPYRPVPKGVRQKAQAPCLCYASLLERLSERFHAAPALLRTLNPGVDFATAPAGTRVTVPNTWRLTPKQRVARLVVTKREGSVRGMAADGRTLFWLPATVGSTSMPSPQGELRVTSVTRDPHYRWDPDVLKDVSRSTGVQMLPPGPNSPVGSVWVALSRPRVGIHGTPDPEHVGYTASHGCVRVTNWDALWVARIARSGLTVEFQ
jgi:lipoprotein-anchoring transpeptidase ErfK/SrfK